MQGDPTRPAGAVEVQAPAWQLCPAAHARPQLPQLAGSVLRLTRRPLQLLCGLAQQTPFWQVWGLVHRLPHAPQFCGSIWSTVQLEPQRVEVEGHSVTQNPFEQNSPVRHWKPH